MVVIKESFFNTEIVNSIKYHGGWAYKVPDMPVSMLVGLRYTPEKPCDILASHRGFSFAIEGKMLKGYQAFHPNVMRPSQVREFNDMSERDMLAFVFLNIRRSGDSKKSIKHANNLIIFEWTHLRDHWEANGSIKKNELEELSFLRGSKSRFDLRKFLDNVRQTYEAKI